MAVDGAGHPEVAALTAGDAHLLSFGLGKAFGVFALQAELAGLAVDTQGGGVTVGGDQLNALHGGFADAQHVTGAIDIDHRSIGKQAHDPHIRRRLQRTGAQQQRTGQQGGQRRSSAWLSH